MSRPESRPHLSVRYGIPGRKKSRGNTHGARAIVLLTDGKDEKGKGRCSTYAVSDVIDGATTKTIRVPIYTIGVGPKIDAQELGRISRLTGGRNLIAETVSELKAFYQIIADQLKNQYVVKYISQTPSGEHSLVVKVRREEKANRMKSDSGCRHCPSCSPPKCGWSPLRTPVRSKRARP